MLLQLFKTVTVKMMDMGEFVPGGNGSLGMGVTLCMTRRCFVSSIFRGRPVITFFCAG